MIQINQTYEQYDNLISTTEALHRSWSLLKILTLMYCHYNDIHFHYHDHQHHHQHHDLGGGGGQLIPWNWIHYFYPCPPVPGHHHFGDDDDDGGN